jgi:hypothetical protein
MGQAAKFPVRSSCQGLGSGCRIDLFLRPARRVVLVKNQGSEFYY